MKHGTPSTVQTKITSFQGGVLLPFLLFMFHCFCLYFFFIPYTLRLWFLTLGGTLLIYVVRHAGLFLSSVTFVLVICRVIT